VANVCGNIVMTAMRSPYCVWPMTNGQAVDQDSVCLCVQLMTIMTMTSSNDNIIDSHLGSVPFPTYVPYMCVGHSQLVLGVGRVMFLPLHLLHHCTHCTAPFTTALHTHTATCLPHTCMTLCGHPNNGQHYSYHYYHHRYTALHCYLHTGWVGALHLPYTPYLGGGVTFPTIHLFPWRWR